MTTACDLRRTLPSVVTHRIGLERRSIGSIRRFHFSVPLAAPISRNMADNTRFDLSRLEGCTGTLSESGVAVPHSLSPSRERPEDRDAPGATETSAATNDEPTLPQIGSAAPNKNTAPLVAARVADSEATPALVASMRLSPRSVEAIVAERSKAIAARTEADESDGLPIAIIVSLTLAAWIPVLLLWSSRLG